MTDTRRVSFVKMHGTGNDFIVFDNRSYRFSRDELSTFAAAWCPRRYGVGADGLLALDRPESAKADFRMHYVNADGSRATMCGNGARCLARYAVQNGFETPDVAFDTDAGLYRAVVAEADTGPVRLFVPEVTDVRSEVTLEQTVPDGIEALYYVYAGTEHLVACVSDVSAVPIEDWGAHLRGDPALAPAGANANFLRVSGTDEIAVRTFEKGVEGETPSCGTGVLAAAAVAERSGRVGEGPVTVRTKGGELRVGTASTPRGPQRYLEGPAVAVFEGRVPVPPQ